MFKQLSIGTAQFGLDYGISNISGKISSSELDSIFHYMQSKDLFEFDAAQSYGDAESKLAKFLKINGNELKTKIVTKFSLNKPYEYGDIEKLLTISLNKLGVKSLFGLLLHNLNDYKCYPELWQEMLMLKSKRIVKKVGFSLYYPHELEFILKDNLDFNIIQIPFNVFDQRFKKYFPQLDALNILVYFRSIFMQGLVFLDPRFINSKLDLVKKNLQSLNKISSDSGFDINSLCLNFALLQNSSYKIIIGVASLAELEKNISSLNKFSNSHEIYERLNGLRINDEAMNTIIEQMIRVTLEKLNKKNK